MSLANSPPPKRSQRGLLSTSFALAAYSAEDPEGPDSAPDVLSSGAGVSDKPSLAYLRDHVVRLAGGTACPNCNRTLRAIDAIIDFDDPGVVLRCWNCHADILQVEEW
jgi:hypothetical protein